MNMATSQEQHQTPPSRYIDIVYDKLYPHSKRRMLRKLAQQKALALLPPPPPVPARAPTPLTLEMQRYNEHLARLRYQRSLLRQEQQQLRERRRQYKLTSNVATMSTLVSSAKTTATTIDNNDEDDDDKLPAGLFDNDLFSASAAPPLSPDTFHWRIEYAQQHKQQQEPLELPLALLSEHWRERLERRLDSDVLELPPSAVVSYPRSFYEHKRDSFDDFDIVD